MLNPNEKAPDALQGTVGQKSALEIAQVDVSTLAALVAILTTEVEQLKRKVAWLESEQNVRDWARLEVS